MITSFEVRKLNGSFDFQFDLHPDLNLLTGKNGVGKTTILKIIYYIISGNIEKLIPEIPFEYVCLIDTHYVVEIIVAKEVATINWTMTGFEKKTIKVACKAFEEDSRLLHPVDFDIAEEHGSVFFPTFRRIEGGFTIAEKGKGPRSDTLQGALNGIVQSLTFMKNAFVASVSTDDIEALLTKQYADVSNKAIKLQTDLSESIMSLITGFKESEAFAKDQENLNVARQILTDIRHKITDLEAERLKLFKPFKTLDGLIKELMEDKGVKIKEIISFGDLKRLIDAPKLSAGEKQMLSFLCYNAFTRAGIILIDEPEISLHVDWQRSLFPKLLEQGSENQFIVTTHSPFIYSKYPDKEIMLDKSRGNTHE